MAFTSIARSRGVANYASGSYRRKPVSSYTDACEAPFNFWRGAIPLRNVRVVKSDGTQWNVQEKTYSHPKEINPSDLSFADINRMYCIGNDDLIATYPEGLGGKVMQLMPPGHPRGFLFRKQSYLINQYVRKCATGLIPGVEVNPTLRALAGGRPGFIVDGATGTGKSALMAQAVHYARSRGILTVYVPNAKDWTHGEWCWPSVLLPGFWDAPDASRMFLHYFSRAQQAILNSMPLRVTPKDLPTENGESKPSNVYELCIWGAGAKVGAPNNIDRQSVGIKYVMDELMAYTEKPILFVIDGMNLFSLDTHFRFPHPDFLKSMTSLKETDIDLYPQELPRIPAARFTFVRALNKMMHDALTGVKEAQNKYFITSTTRDFKPYDGGVSGFSNPEIDKHATSLDEYAPFHAEKDTVLHPLTVSDFDEYEYRSFLRFLVNSGELAGFGWGPLWHYSSDFERKLYKIEFMSKRNPQKVVDHYHQEITWVMEYPRLRQKQHMLHQENRRAVLAAAQTFASRQQQQAARSATSGDGAAGVRAGPSSMLAAPSSVASTVAPLVRPASVESLVSAPGAADGLPAGPNATLMTPPPPRR